MNTFTAVYKNNMIKAILAAPFILLPSFCIAQKKDNRQLSAQQQNEILQQLNSIDSAKLLKEVSAAACLCIDSVHNAKKPGGKNDAQAISKCIDDQASAYQITLKLMRSMKSPGNKMELNFDKNSPEYTNCYRDIERLTRDSCNSLIASLSFNYKSKTYSKNPKAIAAYEKGIGLLRSEKYGEALPHFEQAVKIDTGFATAWDNVGICNRRLGNFEKSVEAYKKSLAIDPEGKTAMQNLPIVYELLKKYDEALAGYENILKRDAKDPEGYFGRGRVYFIQKNDLETSLDNFCKAYNIYIEAKSPYAADAQRMIGILFQEMKKAKKEAAFDRILKENNIKTK